MQAFHINSSESTRGASTAELGWQAFNQQFPAKPSPARWKRGGSRQEERKVDRQASSRQAGERWQAPKVLPSPSKPAEGKLSY